MLHARIRPAAWLTALLALLAATPAPAEGVDEKAQACAGCHGENGVPQQKTRKNDIMGPIAQTLERDDMMALAQYFSQKPWPNLQQPRPPADVAARALQAMNAVVCSSCHQSQYQGDGTQPRLAGQWKDYLQQSMIDFRNRSRANNPGMSDLMLSISEDDIAACAAYLAGL